MSRVSQLTERFQQTVASARARWPVVDHAFRAIMRYLDCYGARLAAAVAYYGFFATFALGLLAFSVLGFLVDQNVDLRDTVEDFLADNIPVVDAAQISAGRGAASIFGLVGLILAGVAWVEAMRSSQRQLWQLEQMPGGLVLRRAIDVLALLGLAVLVGITFSVAVGVERLLAALPAGTVLARIGGTLLTLGVNLVLAIALLAVLPRLRISARRLLPAACAVAVGLFLLNTIGLAYIGRVQENPAYTVVATAAGLLVYLYLFHQVLLVAAAWAATSEHGSVKDLTDRGSKKDGDGEGDEEASEEPLEEREAEKESAGTPPGSGVGG